jgi:NTP pyrophosphatase (non-canonical NTP hydrolase)
MHTIRKALLRKWRREKNKSIAMTIEEAQKTVDSWITTTGVRYFNELTNMAMLTEEVGEVARIIARKYGEQSFKESDKGKELSDELADVLFVLICIANQTGVNLTDALQKNLDKKTNRDGERHKNNEKLS